MKAPLVQQSRGRILKIDGSGKEGLFFTTKWEIPPSELEDCFIISNLYGRPQWIKVKGGSEIYISKVVDDLRERGVEIRVKTAVTEVESLDDGRVRVEDEHGGIDVFDKCVVTVQAPDALKIRGSSATTTEKKVLGAFKYYYTDIYVHRDKSFMPKNSAAWSAWNFLGDIDKNCCVTYWLNLLQLFKDGNSSYGVENKDNHTRERPNHLRLRKSQHKTY